ncbi:hypothetical protein LZ30DRAFT_718897 [Colletotrichum cereale]|nr:hypothetical protein LZ30DRAFT_718897 [Colletotrichum cereale]
MMKRTIDQTRISFLGPPTPSRWSLEDSFGFSVCFSSCPEEMAGPSAEPTRPSLRSRLSLPGRTSFGPVQEKRGVGRINAGCARRATKLLRTTAYAAADGHGEDGRHQPEVFDYPPPRRLDKGAWRRHFPQSGTLQHMDLVVLQYHSNLMHADWPRDVLAVKRHKPVSPTVPYAGIVVNPCRCPLPCLRGL